VRIFRSGCRGFGGRRAPWTSHGGTSLEGTQCVLAISIV